MANKEGETVSRIGNALKQDAFDSAPILVTPSMFESKKSVVDGNGSVKKTMLDEDEDFDDDIKEETSVTEIDVFEPVIKKLKVSQSPAVKSAIENTPCFAKVWYSQEDKDYCPEIECGLRNLCEAAYHQAVESVEAEVEVKEEMEGIRPSERILKVIEGGEKVQEDDLAKIKQSGRKLQKKRRGRASTKPRNTSQNVSVPYVNQGRPVDVLASMLSASLNPKELELTDNWKFRIKTVEMRKAAKVAFEERYGSGMVCSKRASYHLYLWNGMYLLRFWVNAANVAIVDMNPHLAQEADRCGLRTFETPVKNPKHNYNFFPKRTKIRGQIQMETLIEAVKKTLSEMIVQ